MDNLSRHIQQAQQDVTEVHTSSQKISSRFAKIEAVQLQPLHDEAPQAVTDRTES